MTHMGNSSKPEALVRQALRSGMSDGWGGAIDVYKRQAMCFDAAGAEHWKTQFD